MAERSYRNPTLEVIERAYIMWVLQAEGGNKTRAAEVLGIDPSTLYRKLTRYEEQVEVRRELSQGLFRSPARSRAARLLFGTRSRRCAPADPFLDRRRYLRSIGRAIDCAPATPVGALAKSCPAA